MPASSRMRTTPGPDDRRVVSDDRSDAFVTGEAPRRGSSSRDLAATRSQASIDGREAVREPGKPAPVGRIRATGAVVLDDDDELPPEIADGDIHLRRARMPGRVRESLGDDEVGRRLDVPRQSTVEVDRRLDRDRRPPPERPHRRGQALVLQQCRVDPRASSRRSAMAAWSSSAATPRRPRARPTTRHPRGLSCLLEGDGHGDQPLLGAVVQVALDAPAFVFSRNDQPRTGRAAPLRAGSGVRRRAVRSRRRDGARRNGTHKGRVLAKDGVVDDRCERPALVLEQRDRVVLVLDRAAAGRPSAAVHPGPADGRSNRTSGSPSAAASAACKRAGEGSRSRTTASGTSGPPAWRRPKEPTRKPIGTSSRAAIHRPRT